MIAFGAGIIVGFLIGTAWKWGPYPDPTDADWRLTASGS